jgi:hypothetical protein
MNIIAWTSSALSFEDTSDPKLRENPKVAHTLTSDALSPFCNQPIGFLRNLQPDLSRYLIRTVEKLILLMNHPFAKKSIYLFQTYDILLLKRVMEFTF